MITEERLDELRMLSTYHRKFLNTVLLLGATSTDKIKFSDLVKETGYSSGRVSQILKYFDEYLGIICSSDSNKGRAGGRTKEICFSSEEDIKIIKKSLFGEEYGKTRNN